MGRDRERAGGRIDVGISIHSPRMGRDEGLRIDADRLNVFQSTLPAWGETSERCTPCRCRPDFNPLSPHGERRGRDSRPLPYSQFQSTLPAWGETGQDPGAAGHHPISIHSPRMGRDQISLAFEQAEKISIHSPRMGRDHTAHSMPWEERNFNPLSPHGERRGLLPKCQTPTNPFQSTLPAWGETAPRAENPFPSPQISIHSPRMGRDYQ